MKIAIIITSLEVGGAEKMILDLINGVKIYHQIKLFVIKKSFNTIFDCFATKSNIDIIYLNGNGKIFSLITANKLKRLLDDYRPNIIHTNLKSSSYIYYYYLFNKDFKWIHTVHTIARIDCKFFRRIFFRKLYNKKVIKLVAVSDRVYQSLIKLYQDVDVELIYNGINLDNFQFKRKVLDDQINICHIGRFAKVKNHHYIITEFANLMKRYQSVFLYLVGDGKFKKRIKQLVARLDISERVKFCGYAQDVTTYLKKSHIFWLPSLYEGLPTALIEAMSSGLVCVTSTSANNMVIDNKINGFVIDLKNNELAFITDKIIKHYNRLDKIRLNATKRAKDFSFQKMIERYIDLYGK